LNANHNKLKQLLITLNYSFDVIVLTEIWAFNISFYKNLLLDYNFIFKIPIRSNIGGVGLFIRNTFTIIERTDLNLSDIENNNDFEHIFVEISNFNYSCIIGAFYRHPHQNVDSFITSLENKLQSSKLKCNLDRFLLGDININLLNYQSNNNTKKYLDMMNSLGFLPLITLPTRLSDASSTLIDHIFFCPASKSKHLYLENSLSGIITVDISDHLPSFAVMLTRKPVQNKDDRPLIRIFSVKNKLAFANELQSFDWESNLYSEEDVDTAYEFFINTLLFIFNKYFPLVKLSRKRAKDKCWVTPEVIKSSNHKNHLYKNWIKSKNPQDKTKYLNYKKIYETVLKLAERSYYKCTFDSKMQSNKFIWKAINNLCCKDSKKSNHPQSVPKIIVNGIAITNSDCISKEFNSYFCNVGSDLASKLPPIDSNCHYSKFLTPSISNSFVCDLISVQEIQNKLFKYKSKSSCGPDSLNGKLIFEFESVLLLPLQYIYNLSLEHSIFPQQLKIAKILPLHKKGDKFTVSNYRPISLLNTFSKIFESIISDRLSSYLIKYNILYEYQFGFRKNYSTKLALLDSVDDVLKSLSNRNYVAAIFFDLAKAFDSLDRNILLAKLENYGIRGSMYNWFKSYLSNRKQFVSLNDIQSPLSDINYGVPQGSVLGPLLFLIFINDIGKIPNLEAKPKIFADDTNMFIHGKDLPKLTELCQISIDKIFYWLTSNRLSINYDKTYYMLFSPSKNENILPSPELSLTINNYNIKKVASTKFLGIIIDENLDWKIHLQDLCLSLRKFVGVFYKISLKLSPNILRLLYFSLIYSRILYAIELYANTYLIYLHDIMALNNRILRIVQRQSLKTKVIELYKSFNSLPINKLFQFQLLIHAHTIHFRPSILPNIITSNYHLNNEVHLHNTRSSHDFHRITVSTVLESRISYNMCSKLWNSLPLKLKSESQVQTFKNQLKLYLINHDI